MPFMTVYYITNEAFQETGRCRWVTHLHTLRIAIVAIRGIQRGVTALLTGKFLLIKHVFPEGHSLCRRSDIFKKYSPLNFASSLTVDVCSALNIE